MKSISSVFAFFFIVIIVLTVTGCGTVPESTSDTWESTPPVSMNARLEYRIDSLMNENRRLQQQTDALATENRNLAARSSELETRISVMATEPKPESVVTPTATNTSVATGYEGALEAFRKRAFTDAIMGFENLLKENVRDDLADNCHYWIGESYYGMRQYKDAIEHFKMVLNYKTSEKKDDAQLMIANASWAMGDKAGAREAYNKVITTYPTSPLISKAKEKLAKVQ